MTRRQLEEQSFRSSLHKAKAAFDNKIVKLSIKAKDRCVPLQLQYIAVVLYYNTVLYTNYSYCSNTVLDYLTYIHYCTTREDLLLDWLTTVDDLSLYPPHPSLQELRVRTLHQLPPSLREIMRGPRSRQTAGAQHTQPATGKSKR